MESAVQNRLQSVQFGEPQTYKNITILAYKSRSRKTRSVHQSLESCGGPKSDQGEVWNGIEELQVHACAPSPTSAMSDVYKAREDDLRQCDEVFKPVPNQVGFVAFIGGKPAGLDLVSLTSAYAKLHPKLVRSYALEAIVDQGGAASPLSAAPSTLPPHPSISAFQHFSVSAFPVTPPSPPPDTCHSSLARAFLLDIAAAEERQFPSVGHGTDFRYRTRATQDPSPKTQDPSPKTQDPRPKTQDRTCASQLSAFQHFTLCGTALVHANEVIHAAFFRLDERTKPETMASLRNRRRHYRE